MISDANIVRSQAEIALSYKRLTDINTTQAYYANFSALLRLLASLRSIGGDYFVSILQPPLLFTGKRNGSEGTQDSTKLVSISTPFASRNEASTRITKADGGCFFVVNKDIISANRGYMCPFSREKAADCGDSGLFPTGLFRFPARRLVDRDVFSGVVVRLHAHPAFRSVHILTAQCFRSAHSYTRATGRSLPFCQHCKRTR